MVSAGAELYLVCSNRHSYRLWVSVMSIDPRSLLSRTSNFPTITVPSKPFQVLPHWDINPAKTMATKNRELIVPSRPFQAQSQGWSIGTLFCKERVGVGHLPRPSACTFRRPQSAGATGSMTAPPHQRPVSWRKDWSFQGCAGLKPTNIGL